MRYEKEEIACLWLDSFLGGDALSFRLLEMAGDALSLAVNFEKFSAYLIKAGKECLYNNMRDSLRAKSYVKNLLGELEREGITAVTKYSPDYPEELTHLKHPPSVLYCKGNIRLLQGRKFTVVGSRRTGQSVLKFAEGLTKTLCEHFTIVSGIADGGDQAALSGALEREKCISVLPFGHKRVPASAIAIYREVCQKGLAVTEFPLDFRPQKYSFLVRNRILAALGEGTLALSAGKRSGVLNTCNQALELGKDVFALPYAPGVESGAGCNELIKAGAFLCDSAEDILSFYGLEGKKESEETSEEEKEIIDILKESGELHVYQLAERTGRDIDSLGADLIMLEMAGKVVKTGGNKYSAV